MATWQSSTAVNMTISSDSKTATQADSNNSWSHVARSDGTISAGTITRWKQYMSGSSPNARSHVGLGVDPLTDSSGYQFAVEFAVKVEASQVLFYKNGVHQATTSYSNTSDTEFSIERTTSNAVKVYRESSLIYTFSGTIGDCYFTATSAGDSTNMYVEIDPATSSGGGSSGGGSSEEGSDPPPPGQMYTSSGSTPHNENRPLRIFKSQRSWF